MIGTLMLLDSGRWAIVAKDRDPYEITSGDVFAVEIAGAMKITRMEFAHARGGGRYVSVDSLLLREGMRAATGDDMYAKREMTDDERAGADWWNALTDLERGRRLIELQKAGKDGTVALAWAAEKARRRSR